MKVTKSLILTICLLVIVSMVVTASPLAGATSKTLSTNYTLVNLGASEANVMAAYYKTDGSVWNADDANENFTIAANYGQKIIAQYFDGTLSSGMGSVVISADQQLGAVTQILARNQTPSSGAYIGVMSPANKFYVPQAFRQLVSSNGLLTTQIIIQNASDTTASVEVEFVPFPGIAGLNAYTNTSISIAPGASYIYELSDETNLSSGWTGSSVVTAESGKNIAVVVNTFAGVNSLQTYNAFDENNVGSDWSVPQFVSQLGNGLNTPVLVQNLSGSEIAIDDLTMSCTSADSVAFPPATFSKKNDIVVPANAIFAFNPYNNSAYPANWSGACNIVSATGKDIVVLVQMRKPGVNEEFAAYEGIRNDSTDQRVIVPLISKNQANGFATAVTIKNLDASNSADVTLVYTPSQSYVDGGGAATVVTFDAIIPAGGNLIQSQRFTGTPQIPNGWYGSLVVKPKSGSTPRPLAALVQLTNTIPQAGDTFMAHIAFTQPEPAQ